MKDFEPVEYTLACDDQGEFTSKLEDRLNFIQDALRNAGHPDLDVDNVSFELKTHQGTSTVILKLPKKVKHIGGKFDPPKEEFYRDLRHGD